jgi:hypothetical protein
VSRPTIKVAFADMWNLSPEEKTRGNYLHQFLEKYYDLELSDHPDFLLYSVYGIEYLKYDCLRIHFTAENTRPNLRKCDYAFSFSLEEDERNIRLPYYKFADGFSELSRPRDPDAIIAENRGFCSFVNSNNEAPDRLRFFDALSRYKRVDAGGKSRNNIGYLVKDKQEFLRRYKFTIAFENSCYPGYTTEKLMQALVADTVPIYWGNPAVAVDFDPAAFINCHDYDSFDAVIERVKEVDADEALYRSYLAAPFFPGGRPNECVDDERIFRAFDRIFTTRRVFVPRSIKKLQRIEYFYHRRFRPMVKRWGGAPLRGLVKAMRKAFPFMPRPDRFYF